jgi:ABC-type Na+ efflux pump permease subunit
MEGSEFEFAAAQNDTIRVLASRMKWVGICLIVWGLLLGLGVLSEVNRVTRASYRIVQVLSVIPAVILFMFGVFTYTASQAFGKIVTTTGHDMINLMEALTALKKLYVTHFWFIIACLVALPVVVGLIVVVGPLPPP